jgi:microsomal dipeptidase-like Zn-dependent dipeptidase
MGIQESSFKSPGRRVLADIHVHPLIDDWNRTAPLPRKLPFLADVFFRTFNPTKVSWKGAHRAGVDLMCAAHYNFFDECISMPTDPTPQAPLNALRMLDFMEAELAGPAAPYARLTRNHQELSAALKVRKGSSDFRVAVLHSFEGGHVLGGSLKPLEEFARRGVALLTLGHFYFKGLVSVSNPFPFFYDGDSGWPIQGLTGFGREVIREMERLGMIVDVAHSSAKALEDILKVARKPLVATHVAARTLGEHAYSLYDEHIQEITRRGGLVCIILNPRVLSNFNGIRAAETFGALRDSVRTIRYVSKICGSHRGVGIGTDFQGYTIGPRDMSRIGEIDRLHARLLREFEGDSQQVEDIMANNVMNFLLAHWRTGL